MRQFVLLAHDVPTEPTFSLDDLAGGAGRLDAICRSITAALLRSHGIREAVRVHLVVQDQLTISFDGREIRRLNPDERSTAARIRTALEHKDEAIGALPAEPSPGVSLFRRGLDSTLDALDGPTFLLHEDGEPIVDSDTGVPTAPVFVLSDHHDFTDTELAVLEDATDQRVRLGPTAVHADQAITIAHHYLDTDGYQQF